MARQPRQRRRPNAGSFAPGPDARRANHVLLWGDPDPLARLLYGDGRRWLLARERAPRGGTERGGQRYAGGQFLPGVHPSSGRGGGGSGRSGGKATGRLALPRLLGPLAGLPGYVTEHTAGGPAFNQSVAWGLRSVPFHVHDVLHREGYRVVTGDLLVHIDPGLAGQRPRGYPPGVTWEAVGGCYDEGTRRALVAAQVLRRGSLRPTPYVDGTCREEVGHALDWSLGSRTEPASHIDPQFLQAYQADAAAIADPAEQALLEYFLQPNQAGNEETFAYLFAIMHGGAAGTPAFQQLVGQRFARSRLAVQAVVYPP